MLEPLRILADLLSAILASLLGRKGGRWTVRRMIPVPRDLVWAVASSRDITFPGTPPITIKEVPSPRPGDIVMLEMRSGDIACATAYRQLERREGEGELYELVAELSDPMVAQSGLERSGYGLADVPGGTEITVVQEGHDVAFATRLNTPIGMRLMLRRIEAECFRRAGTTAPGMGSRATTSIVLAVLSFAAAWYMLGLAVAALLMVIIFLHELGHVGAMWLVGVPVKGIFFIPFLGAIAMWDREPAGDFEDGFVTLMGPFLSIVPTLGFLALHAASGPNIATVAAVLSAFVNLLALLPIVPNDGGHIARVTLRAVSPAFAQVLAWAGVAAGFALAYAWGSYVVGLLIAFGALGLRGASASDTTRPPMSRRAALALISGSLLAAAVYLAVLLGLLGNEGTLNLVWPPAQSPA